LRPKNFKERLKITTKPGGPLTVVGDRVLMGFSAEEFEEAFRDFQELTSS
jgi:hypothetical protein